ncbi:MAG: Na+/H+ antiporter [Chloroflexia bacterium]|nr:Na+/H+ antiporter [Chloroflexia bacterium]
MEEFIATESLIVLLILVTTLVAIIVRRIRLPYTLSLVVVGLAISILGPLEIHITPELILSIFVPPLIFEAAFHLDFRLLRANLFPILMLAVPGVLLAMLLIGGGVALGTGLPLTSALVFGALIAATDPVAVVALFRAMGVPQRLAVALEGESLFNDGTAIVLFQIALVAALSGTFDPLGGVLDFFRIALGGVATGALLGWLVANMIRRIDDRLIVTMLTTLLAYGAYLIAERLHFSGVLAIVLAGVVSGNLGMTDASPSTKIMLYNLWDYLAFLANSLIFLFIGAEVDLAEIWKNIVPISVAVAAVLISRAIVVYGLAGLTRLLKPRLALPFKWKHVLFWGGLRGAISLALALSLPVELADRHLLLAMAFGVLLFTLLAQGTTIQFLVKHLRLAERPNYLLERQRYSGRLFAAQAGLQRLQDLYQEGLLTREMWIGLTADYEHSQQKLEQHIAKLFLEYGELERLSLLQARREALLAERGALNEGLRRGLFEEEVYQALRDEIDHHLEALDLIADSIQQSFPISEEH